MKGFIFPFLCFLMYQLKPKKMWHVSIVNIETDDNSKQNRVKKWAYFQRCYVDQDGRGHKMSLQGQQYFVSVVRFDLFS